MPESGLCRYKGVPVACGPPGLTGGKNVLYHNKGDGTFEDVSDRVRITGAGGTYGLGVSTLDFDDDGWTDFTSRTTRTRARCIGTTMTEPSRTSASSPAARTARTASRRPAWASPIGDYDHNGTMDIFKTNFAGDTSTLYANTGEGFCEDRTFRAASDATHAGWAGASGSSIWIWMAGSICSS